MTRTQGINGLLYIRSRSAEVFDSDVDFLVSRMPTIQIIRFVPLF
jgi:hypothetical protein